MERTLAVVAEAVVAEAEEYDLETSSSTEFTKAQLITGLLATRVMGIISFVVSGGMVLCSWKRRKGLFHRLVFGKDIPEEDKTAERSHCKKKYVSLIENLFCR